MARFALAAAVLSLILLATLLAVRWTPQPSRPPTTDVAPRTKLEQTKDFGVVDPGTFITHDFQVTHHGKEDLDILKAKSSCGCLHIVKCPKRIPADGTESVTLKFDTIAQFGLAYHKAVLETSDPKAKFLTLAMKGIVRGIWIEPKSVDLGNSSTLERPVRDFTVLSAGLPDAKVTKIASLSDSISIEDGPGVVSGDGERARHMRVLRHVKLDWNTSDLPVGSFTSRVVVSTNVDRYSRVEIPVTGYVAGSVKFRPGKIVFGRVAGGDRVVRTAEWTSTEENHRLDLQEMKFLCEHEFVTVSMNAASDRKLTLNIALQAPEVGSGQLIEGAMEGRYQGKAAFSLPYAAYVVPR